MRFSGSTQRRSLKVIAAVSVLVLLGIALAPRFQASNCGGNTAALHDVKWYSLIVQLAAEENPGHEFRIDHITPKQQEELAQIANDFWVSGARFLVSTRPYRLQSTAPPRLLIVCDQPFRNVPRRLIGSAPPMHAAAFSDGSRRLLSV
ncbi:MAG TPA: hypothetical protein VHC19_14835, partial [Pirellulales bacterium]|nr:hypothetical protein [Pirellulales bacterium]